MRTCLKMIKGLLGFGATIEEIEEALTQVIADGADELRRVEFGEDLPGATLQ